MENEVYVIGFLLDTNVYFLFFQHQKNDDYHQLESKLLKNGIIPFYISEITSMEIHSVLGRYGRGTSKQLIRCDRPIVDGDRADCYYISPGRKPMKPRVFHDLRKLITDVENERGTIKAKIISISSKTIEKARELLMQYSTKFSFGSHDALIAATAIIGKEEQGLDLTVVTSDKGLKAMLKEQGIAHYDPKYN